MNTTSPSKKTTRVNNQENRMIREKNRNILGMCNFVGSVKDARVRLSS